VKIHPDLHQLSQSLHDTFFIIHYGGFTAGHGVFMIALFGEGYFNNQAGPAGDAFRRFILDNNLHLAMLALKANINSIPSIN
jgi:hypothetical protein